MMQSKLVTEEEGKHLLPNKNDRALRRVYSDILTGANEIFKDLNLSTKTNEVETMECECCGMSEDCTPTYISRVKEFFCGRWICGLCAEAVKEKMKRDLKLTMEEALESHMALCKQFNRTTRLNPELSLAGAMRDIARKSHQYRKTNDFCAPKIARPMSYGPRMAVKNRRASFQ